MPSRLKWNHLMEEILCETLVEEVGKGLRADSGYKRDAWTAVEMAMKTQLNIIASTDQLKNKYDTFKIKYKTWYHLANQSAFGRDPHTNAVTAPDEVWDRYLDKHPQAKEFRTSAKPIRYEALLNTLFFDVLATGEEAVDVNNFDEGEDKDILNEEEDALDPRIRLAAVDNLYDEEQSFLQSSNPISQSLSAASSVSSLRKRAGTASASGPSEGLKRIRKTGSEHLAERSNFYQPPTSSRHHNY